MIEIKDKAKCCGCSACRNACPKSCIDMIADHEGLQDQQVRKNECIARGVCERVCHLLHDDKKNTGFSSSFYAAYNKADDAVLQTSSSGGVFWPLAEYMIGQGGVVYGAQLGENFQVAHSRAETLKACERFRRSKYLQSDLGDTFTLVRKDLKSGRKVLFSGVPCQVAALYRYLGTDHENLYTCDVICHGVPSKAVFDRFIAELNEKKNDRATSICWRDKRNGWGPNHISIRFASGKELITTSRENPYQTGFLDDLYLRPSCYACKDARLPRVSDIALADFWGYQGKLLEGNKNRGLSIVITSSEKGNFLFEQIRSKLVYEPALKETVMEKSRCTHSAPMKNHYREKFFKEFHSGRSFASLTKKYIHLPFAKKMARKFRVRLLHEM